MIPDLDDIFQRYEGLRAEADGVFRHLSAAYPDCVACRPGCDDCCHALFDVSLVEAMYINRAFLQKFEFGRARSEILQKASEIDRALARIKKDMFRAEKNGESAVAIMERAARVRMPCPLLNGDRECLLYDDRPITCRLYGVPTSIGGKAHVCGFSGFARGKSYPTVKLEKFQGRLEGLSAEIAGRVGSRFDLADVYVPLSMALLTRYDERYLGIGDAKTDD